MPLSPTSPLREPSAPPAPSLPRARDVLGVPLALIDYGRTLDWMDAMVAARARGYVCVAAVHTVMVCQEDAELRDAVLRASFTVPDGQPLVWAMNALGEHLPTRVYGPELMERACSRAARTGARVYLYGGRTEGALVQLTLNLRRAHPGLKVVGGWSPPHRPLTPGEQAWVAGEIDRVDPDLVFVGIGVPKQEKWMAAMRPQLAAPVLLGVGAAFDFHAGLVPQAPGWMQAAGLEWLYRLGQEPRRLWRRYARYNPRFVAGFARQYASHRRRPPKH